MQKMVEMKKLVKVVTVGLISIVLSSMAASMKPMIVNAASVTNSSLENDDSKQTFVVSDYNNSTLPSSSITVDEKY